MPEEIKS